MQFGINVSEWFENFQYKTSLQSHDNLPTIYRQPTDNLPTANRQPADSIRNSRFIGENRVSRRKTALKQAVINKATRRLSFFWPQTLYNCKAIRRYSYEKQRQGSEVSQTHREVRCGAFALWIPVVYSISKAFCTWKGRQLMCKRMNLCWKSIAFSWSPLHKAELSKFWNHFCCHSEPVWGLWACGLYTADHRAPLTCPIRWFITFLANPWVAYQPIRSRNVCTSRLRTKQDWLTFHVCFSSE